MNRLAPVHHEDKEGQCRKTLIFFMNRHQPVHHEDKEGQFRKTLIFLNLMMMIHHANK
jgi:hypothetical protein